VRPTKAFEEASTSTKAWWSCPGLVYFLGVGKPTVVAIKIGMLAITGGAEPKVALARRLASLQSSNHELVYVLGFKHFKDGKHPTKDAEDLERKLHLEFEYLARFKMNTRGAEWFNAAPELLTEIQSLSQPLGELGISRTTMGTLIKAPSSGV